jgi:hypothetical protein
VRRVREGLERGFLFDFCQVELPRRVVHDVRRDDPVEFLAEGLDGDLVGGGLLVFDIWVLM